MIHGCPNGETHLKAVCCHSVLNKNSFKNFFKNRVITESLNKYFIPEYIGFKEQTRRTETSKYPEEKKSIETPLVVASESGTGQQS